MPAASPTGPTGSALVYLSLGSLGGADVELMQRLVDVLGAQPAPVHRQQGAAGRPRSRCPATWSVRRLLPQTKVIPQVDLVITHGGNNTTTEALHFGKPMVVLPLFWDQYDNAQRMDELGFGMRLETYQFAADELNAAVDGLLADAGPPASGWRAGRQHQRPATASPEARTSSNASGSSTVARPSRSCAWSALDDDLERLGLGGAAEGVVGVEDLLEGEAVGREGSAASLSWATSFSSIGVVLVLTRPGGDGEVHDPEVLQGAAPPERRARRRSRRTRRGGRSSVHASKVAGMPTASIATSTPKPSVIALTWSIQSCVAAVHRVGGTEGLGLLEPVVVEVQGDDPGGAVQARGHHRREPDRSGADDGDHVAGLDPAVAHADLEAGGQDVGQHDGGLVG